MRSMNQVDLPDLLGCSIVQVASQLHRSITLQLIRGVVFSLLKYKSNHQICVVPARKATKFPQRPPPPRPTDQSVPLKGETFPQTLQPNKIMSEPCYTVVAADDDRDTPTQQDLKSQLENGRDDQKIETMKKVLTAMLNGDPMPGLLMHVIRFVTPSKNKTLKKLCLLYWEICPKLQPNGKLKQEMVLVWYVFAHSLLKRVSQRLI